MVQQIRQLMRSDSAGFLRRIKQTSEQLSLRLPVLADEGESPSATRGPPSCSSCLTFERWAGMTARPQ